MNTTVIRLHSIALPPPSPTAFWRFVWKEFRMLRSFWLAVTGLAISGMWLTTQVADPRADLPSILLMAAVGAGVTYAVGAAATLFAVEHEEGTYGFLSVLPSGWSPMFWGKLFAAGSSAITLTMVLGLVVLPLASQWPEPHQAWEIFSQLGLAVPEVLAWGTLFSLLLKRPLIAALLTIVTELIAVNLTANVIPSFIFPNWYLRSGRYADPFRFGMILAVLFVDLWLVRRWWPTDKKVSKGYEGNVDATAVLAQTHVYALSSSPKLRMLGRLVWQTWRQSWTMMGAMLILVYCFHLIFARILFDTIQETVVWNPLLWMPSMALGLIGPAIFSSAILHADNRRQSYSFLASHAVSGTWVWFSRLLVWAGVYTFPMVILPAIFGWWYYGRSFSVGQAVMYFTSIHNIFIGFAIGQFCALMIRQSLVAAFLSVLLSCLFAVWMQIVVAWDLPRLSFLFPVPLGLLLAAWFRAPDWISQRNGLKSWSKVGLAIALPMGLVVARVPHARLSQVTETNLTNVYQNVSPESKQLKEARKSGDQLLQLGRTLTATHPDPNPTDPSDATHRQQPLESMIEICQRPMVRFSDLQGLANSSDIATGSDLAVLTQIMARLAAAGEQACVQNDLDQALVDYLAWWRLYGFVRSGQSAQVNLRVEDRQQSFSEHLLLWAQQESQSASKIKEAIRKLDQMPPWALSKSTDSEYFPPNPQENIWADHNRLLDVLEEQREPIAWHDPTQRLALSLNKFSFERQRSIRVLTALTAERLISMRQVLDCLKQVLLSNFHPPSTPAVLSSSATYQSHSTTYQAEQLRRSVQQTYLFEKQRTRSSKTRPTYAFESQLPHRLGSWLRTSYLLKNEYLPVALDEFAFMRHLVHSMVRHLGLKTQLALIAYRMNHDAYPETLMELVPNYLSHSPTDPYSGRPFNYRPAGVPGQLTNGYHQTIAIQPDTPFFWSVGSAMLIMQQHQIRFGGYEGDEAGIGGYGFERGYGGKMGGGEGGMEYGGEYGMDDPEEVADAEAQEVAPDNLTEIEAEGHPSETKHAATPGKTRTVYVLAPQEGPFDSMTRFVFQLPKSTTSHKTNGLKMPPETGPNRDSGGHGGIPPNELPNEISIPIPQY